MANDKLYMNSDNLIKYNNLQDVDAGTYINTATVDMSLFKGDTINPDAAAVENASGYAKITITDHTLTTSDFIRISGSENYDGQWDITAVETNKITIDATYVAETLTGSEVIYVGVEDDNVKDISLTPKGSDGNYTGIIPDSAARVLDQAFYFLFIKAVYSGSVLLSRKKLKAVFHPEA